jgi:hypothetical protein
LAWLQLSPRMGRRTLPGPQAYVRLAVRHAYHAHHRERGSSLHLPLYASA